MFRRDPWDTITSNNCSLFERQPLEIGHEARWLQRPAVYHPVMFALKLALQLFGALGAAGLDREQARGQGVIIANLEDDQDLPRTQSSVFTTPLFTLSLGPLPKLSRIIAEKLSLSWSRSCRCRCLCRYRFQLQASPFRLQPLRRQVFPPLRKSALTREATQSLLIPSAY